jgi:15-cis-phytoene synthase
MPDARDAVVARSHIAIARGSRSFHAASQLFEPRIREDVWLLYAWCRHCDDQIDGQDHGGDLAPLCAAERRTRLAQLRRLTQATLDGEPVDEPAFVALQQVARRHRIEPRWPADLLQGLEMDADERRYQHVEDTLGYCWAVAGVVGVMMAQVMGVRDPTVLRRAQDLGLAFQLTNICRDVLEDARGGRVYLPADLLRRHGVEPTPSAVADPRHARGVFAATQELLARAESFYASSRVGLRDLPLRSAMAVAAARGIYREIGRRIRRQGPAALAARVTVPTPTVAWLLLRGAAAAAWSRVERRSPPPARPVLWTRI